jgi:hypothetical protein
VAASRRKDGFKPSKFLTEKNDFPYERRRVRMIIIGVLLLAAALVFGVDLVLANHHHGIVSPLVFGQSLGVHSQAAVFVIGVVTGAAILLALTLLASGLRRQGARAVNNRRDRREAGTARDERDDLAEDNRSLRAELEAERAANQRTVVVERPVEAVDTTAGAT